MAGKQADIKVGILTNYDDKGLNQAKTGLAGFSSSIKDADGVGGKFAAGWGNIKSQVSANAGAMAVAAGGALVAFGAKAVGAFTDTSKAAIDLSTSTGLAIEEASRWIAVGDDYEVGAEALATGLGKVAKTMDATKWKKYGIETREAGGAAKSTNDILLDTLDMLSKVDNKTEQARIGQELFGKGYQSLTPILGHTREEYEKMLGTVEDGQVITKEEAEKAEEWRLAQDNLSDALHDVTLRIGEQVAGLAPLVEGLTSLIGLQQKSGLLPNPLTTLSGAINDTRDAYRIFSGEQEEGQQKLAGTTVALAAATAAAKAYGTELQGGTVAADGLTIAEAATKGATEALKDATEEATRKSEAYANSLQRQLDKLDALYPKEYSAVQAKYDFAESSRQAMIDTDALNQALGSSKTKQEDLTAATDTAKESIFAASEDYATLEGAALGSQGAIQRQIDSLTAQAASLAPGSELRLYLEQYIADLAAIPSNVSTALSLHVSSDATNVNAPGYSPRNGGARAMGGPVAAGQAYTVGEEGPETLVMGGQSGAIIPNGGGPTNITINMPVGSNGDDVVRALKKTVGRNGVPDFLRPKPGVSGGTP